MCGDKSDAVTFLKSSIDRYGEELDALQRRMSESAGNLAERVQLKMQQAEFTALIEDAARLLSQLGG
jgi:hypothetical protein